MKKNLQKTVLSLVVSLWSLVSFAQGQESMNVPLSVIDVGNKNYKLGINVSVAGGPPSLVTFDTGGSGLHIFASQVGNSNILYTKEHIKSTFMSGLVYEGVVALAPVTIGNISTAPIPILVVQKTYCQANKPNCGAGQDPNNPSLIMGHFYGELGAGMIPENHNNDPQKTLFTPLRALPGNYSSGFIIEGLGPDAKGQLVLGLSPTNTAGFNTVQLQQLGSYSDGSHYYNDKGLEVQYSINGFGETLRTAFDTGGGSAVQFFTGNEEGYLLRGNLVAPQQNFSASLPGAFDWQFATGHEAGINRVRIGPVIPKKGLYVNTGISFYFQYDVIYDFKNGVLGFRPHE